MKRKLRGYSSACSMSTTKRTNLIPASDDPPTPDTDPGGHPLTFQTSDPRPNDWWLALTGAAKQALQDKSTISDAIPTESGLENRSNVGGEVRWQVNENNGLAIVETADSQVETAQYTVDGKTFHASYSNDPYLYFRVDDHFLPQETDGRDVTIEVEYLDSSNQTFRIAYDGIAQDFELSDVAQLSGSGQWRTHRFEISDAQFGNGQNGASDFRIEKAGGNLMVRRVVVVKESVLSVSSNFGAMNTDSGMHQVIPADGQTVSTNLGGRDARMLTGATSSRYMYFRSDDDFANQVNAGLNAIVEVVYFDSGTGSLNIQYDSTSAAYKPASPISLQDSGEWRTARFYLDDAYFGSRQNSNADFRILGDDIPIDQVRVLRDFGDLLPPAVESVSANINPGQGSVTISWHVTDDWITGLTDQWSEQANKRVQLTWSNNGGTTWSVVDDVFEVASPSAVSSYDTSTGQAVWSDQYEWDTSNLAAGSYHIRVTPIDGRGNLGVPSDKQEVTLSDAPALLGDYNSSGAVDLVDYTVWRANLGASVEPYSGADGNGDGQITQFDYSVWKSNFGATLTPPPAISSASILHAAVSSEPTQAPAHEESAERSRDSDAGFALFTTKNRPNSKSARVGLSVLGIANNPTEEELLLLLGTEVAQVRSLGQELALRAHDEAFSEESGLADLLYDPAQVFLALLGGM